jgi:hypothetical protein
MPRRRKWKWAAVVLGALFTGFVAPYTVERLKGTPPDQIWGIIWHPFQLATDWLAADRARRSADMGTGRPHS